MGTTITTAKTPSSTRIASLRLAKYIKDIQQVNERTAAQYGNPIPAIYDDIDWSLEQEIEEAEEGR